MQKKWKITQPDPVVQSRLVKELNIHPVFAQVLINRGISECGHAESFLKGDASCLHDPFQLKDMEGAVGRIRKAIKKKEKILIFGDYDVDGLTSCALLHSVLATLGAESSYYIPHRVDEGYSLNKNAASVAGHRGATLLITVDCGINSHKEVELLNKHGIDVIIVDHHQQNPGTLPLAVAIVNPKQDDCTYPYKDLAAVGVVFKLAQALTGKPLEEYLDLVALGTVADVMALNGENRILVKEGLKYLNTTKRPGLRALIDSCNLKGKTIMPGFISYIIGPRINASGRIGSAEHALKLLLTESETEAGHLAAELNRYNRQRQRIEEGILDEALGIIERDVNFKEHRVIVVDKEGWHQGVLGIIASKIADRFYRPAIVISTQDGKGKGSARSIERFHIFEALSRCSDILEGFGGHKYAAGITILPENIAHFRELINRLAHEMLSEEDLTPSLTIDAEIPLSSLDLEVVSEIAQLGPFGVGNPYPVFCSRNLTLKSPPAVVGKDTVKFWATDGERTCCVIGFGMGEVAGGVAAAKHIDIAYSPTLDTWSSPTAIQLELKDIRTG